MSAPSRRMVLGGGALTVFFALAVPAGAQEGHGATAGLPGDLKRQPRLDSWIRVGADGRITVFTGKAELGQGIKTALLQVAAHELDAPLAQVDLITADTGLTPNEGVTAGSHSMQDSGGAIRNAAANVRWLLIEAAARRWSLPPAGLTTGLGAVQAPDGRSLPYGALATALDLAIDARPDVPFRPPGRGPVGRDVPRIDIPAKLAGGAAYVQDFRPEGLVHARVIRGPSEGTALGEVDIAGARAMPGVIAVVRKGRFLAVVAEREWQAIQAQQRLQTAPSHSTAQRPNDIHAWLLAAPAQAQVILDLGEAAGGAPTASAAYTRPYLMHGSIGPSCAVAHLQDGELTVWTHTQGVFPLRRAIAQLVGLPQENVRCRHFEGAGCYGHNGADDAAGDAALIAMALPGRPVRMQWMREQEHGWEPLGSAMVTHLSASLTPEGRVGSWRHDVWSTPHNTRPQEAGRLIAGAEVDPPFAAPPPQPIPMPEGGGDRNAIPLYAFPAARVTNRFVPEMPLRVSALRSLGAHMNVFSIESFMDELALMARADPVTFRLTHLEDPRARDVVAAAARQFGWQAWRRMPGRGRGFGFARYKNLGAYCAVALEVEVEPVTGTLSVGRIVSAVDSGQAVSPDGIRSQIEGAIVQSLSWTMIEQVAWDSDQRTSFDWGAYPILRFPALPKSVEVEVIDRPTEPFLGTGEAGQGPTAAALANAVADATGKRLRDLPITAEKVKAAIG
ncbi:MAG TPA: molybdopterin cofactor-binding domain-containing protein [Caulobacteraceae bacterium]|nr:molybdopterin cofactor-binding domain-containing protein [Caulobacteraceae bacterium]